MKPVKKVGKTSDNYALWECDCLNCGGTIQVSSRTLKEQISCGCVKSKGEAKISQLLSSIGLKYKKEVKFDTLKDKDFLRFDFGIYNEFGQLIALIEFQGRQHFASDNSGWNNLDHLEKTQKHDNMKRKFCEQNNIKLIEIPYYDFEKINEEYIKGVIYNVDSRD